MNAARKLMDQVGKQVAKKQKNLDLVGKQVIRAGITYNVIAKTRDGYAVQVEGNSSVRKFSRKAFLSRKIEVIEDE